MYFNNIDSDEMIAGVKTLLMIVFFVGILVTLALMGVYKAIERKDENIAFRQQCYNMQGEPFRTDTGRYICLEKGVVLAVE